VANLFVTKGRLVIFKHVAGCTIVFIIHGAGRTIESHPKFQNSSLFVGIFMLYLKYLLAIGLHSFQAHLRQDKDLQGDKLPFP